MAWEVQRLAYRFGGNSRRAIYDFRYNPMHDLESIWWIAIWTLLRNTPEDVIHSDAQKVMYQDVFKSKMRGLVLRDNATFQELRETLPPEFNSDKIIDPLNAMRSKLVQGYAEASASPVSFNCEPYNDKNLPSVFDKKLTEIVEKNGSNGGRGEN